MFTRIYLYSLALLVALSFSQTFAQSDSVLCGTTLISQQTQIGGDVITSFGTLKVLLIMIDFPDDTIDVNNPTWPVGSGPNFLTAIVDSTETQNSGVYANLSTFFNNMSYGQFRMIGQAYYVQAPRTLSYYQAKYRNSESAYAARDAIQLLDQAVDFADYDRWIDASYNHTLGQDGIVDMVFICYRRWYLYCGLYCGSFPAEGWYCAYLPGDVYVDGGARRITSCHAVNALQLIQYPRLEHLVHEFGHAWGLNHQYAGGFWSLMGHRFPTNSSFMNSVEREQLGWIAFHDISSSQTASLRDFGIHPDAYRISIGNGEYFILENHQLGSPYDFPSIDGSRGLYVIRQVPGYENTLSVETARGRFNWTNPFWAHYPTNGAWIPVFQQGQSNRTGGANERTALYAVDPNTGQGGYNLVQAKFDPVTNQTLFIGFCTCGFYRGSYGDQFDATNCAVFSPWSNPSACTRSGSLTNIGFEVLPSSISVLDIQFFIGNPVSSSPSKPHDVHASVYIDQYSYRHPRLTWAPMLEPDVTSGGNVLVYRRTKIQSPTWSSWALFATQAGDSTGYTDMSISTAGMGTTDSVQYRLQARDNTQKLSVYSDVLSMTVGMDFWKIANTNEGTPETFALSQNYPNPFNPTTTLSYALPEDVHVSLKVFDLLGREVLGLIDEVQKAGRYQLKIDGSKLASGVYFYKLQAGTFTNIKRMLLLK